MPRWFSFDAFLTDANAAVDDAARQALVDELLQEQPTSPWIENDKATFFYVGDAESAALNMDSINADPPFLRMERLEGTPLWFVSHRFEPHDLLDYLLAINDPMTPLAGDPDVAERIARYWQPDPRNPLRLDGGGMSVSVLRMNEARAYADWASFQAVPRGRVEQHSVDSEELGFQGRTLWLYTPPGYGRGSASYPLLILHDGQWAAGPLQVPAIADALIKYNRMQPAIIAMLQSAAGADRDREYLASEAHYQFLLTELLPFIQIRYRIDESQTAVGGVALGAVAALHAALNNPSVFSRLMLISPPLGKGQGQEQLRELVRRMETAEELPARIFQSVGRYEAKARFVRPAHNLRDTLQAVRETEYHFTETGSGHGLVGFRSVLPEALAWMFPGSASARQG
jgi:enterochelin esterase family protein